MSLSKMQLDDARLVQDLPERILQIGEGRFMRGFLDWFIHRLNVSGQFLGRVVVAAPRPSGAEIIRALANQDGLFHVWMRGVARGATVDELELVTSVSRALDPYVDWTCFLACAQSLDLQIIVSNTTEVGLVYEEETYNPGGYQWSYPAKLTAWLFHRYSHFHGAPEAGMTIVPCELVDNNGDLLCEYVVRHAAAWGLSASFTEWILLCNHFCNTLVDRIVTGYPGEEEGEVFRRLGYRDALVTVAEPYFLWAIEGDDRLKEAWRGTETVGRLILTDDISAYRLRKVRILNGAHTALFALALLAGLETVREVVADPTHGAFVRRIIDEEVIPTLLAQGLDLQQVKAFSVDVWDRFSNPFIRHEILSLGLGCIAKMRARLVPTILAYAELCGRAPGYLSIAMAALLLYLQNEEAKWEIRDRQDWVEQVQALWRRNQSIEETVSQILALEDLWGTSLAALPGLTTAVSTGVRGIREHGVTAYLGDVLSI